MSRRGSVQASRHFVGDMKVSAARAKSRRLGCGIHNGMSHAENNSVGDKDWMPYPDGENQLGMITCVAKL